MKNQYLEPAKLFKEDVKKLVEYRTILNILLEQISSPAEVEKIRESLKWIQQALKHVENTKQSGIITPYCHPPNLFNASPWLEPMDKIPLTFIPEPVGGSVIIEDDKGEFIDTESLEFTLNKFLPGGFAIRWKFNLWGAPWQPSSLMRNFVDISHNFDLRFCKVVKFFDLIDVKSPLTQIFSFDLNKTNIYYPEKLIVINLGRQRNFTLDNVKNIVVNKKINAEDPVNTTALPRDPHMQPLSFYVIKDYEKNIPFQNRMKGSGKIFKKIAFVRDLRLHRVYYGSLVTVYRKNSSAKTIPVRYYNDEHNKYALPAIEFQTEGIAFKFSFDELYSIFEPLVRKRVGLEILAHQLRREFLSQELVLENIFQIDQLIQILDELNWYIEFKGKTVEESLKIIESGNIKHEKALLSKITDKDSNIINRPGIGKNILNKADVTRSLAATLASLLIKTSYKLLNCGSGLRGYIDYFTERDETRVVLYDDIKGGSGTVSSLWEKLNKIGIKDFIKQLESSLYCRTEDLDREITRFLLETNSADSLSIKASMGHVNPINIELEGTLKNRLKNLCIDPASAGFSSAIIRLAEKIKKKIGKDPQAALVALELSRSFIFDPRAAALFEKYNKYEGQVSQLKVKIQEILPICLGKCPDCLEGSISQEYPGVDKYIAQEVLKYA